MSSHKSQRELVRESMELGCRLEYGKGYWHKISIYTAKDLVQLSTFASGIVVEIDPLN